MVLRGLNELFERLSILEQRVAENSQQHPKEVLLQIVSEVVRERTLSGNQSKD